MRNSYLVIGQWSFVTCTEFRLRGNRAKSRFNYRVRVVSRREAVSVASRREVLVISIRQRTND
ncbi:MAG: hypothetical protein V7K53_11775 [Nostoc sp.]|uniref:hypothetical protein n=1 Tax=Nostoc sp. TaxID=1180 RepID=UPI002FF961D5